MRFSTYAVKNPKPCRVLGVKCQGIKELTEVPFFKYFFPLLSSFDSALVDIPCTDVPLGFRFGQVSQVLRIFNFQVIAKARVIFTFILAKKICFFRCFDPLSVEYPRFQNKMKKIVFISKKCTRVSFSQMTNTISFFENMC